MDFCMCRERVELDNLKWEHARVSEEAKKEKVPFAFLNTLDKTYTQKTILNVCIIWSSSVASHQPTGNGENEGGTGEEEMLPCTRGPQRKGLA